LTARALEASLEVEVGEGARRFSLRADLEID
jgi:hypothetical protein